MIQFSEYAVANVRDVWKGDHNPVRYRTLDELGFDPADLAWKPMPLPPKKEEVAFLARASTTVRPLTINEAKKGLALAFGVQPEAVEVTIRG
ncbi:MAG: hypothetical protein ACR2F8_00255 [Caulobacteraceae bacterium]